MPRCSRGRETESVQVVGQREDGRIRQLGKLHHIPRRSGNPVLPGQRFRPIEIDIDKGAHCHPFVAQRGRQMGELGDGAAADDGEIDFFHRRILPVRPAGRQCCP
jgi:hypothetical protein